jgi:uncharacterized membrane protein
MPDALLVLSLLTALGAGLVAGAFFAFSTFVMAALGRVPAHEGIRAMQQINITVINPWFMTALFGCVGVTMAFNVPRNNVLARLEPADPGAEETWRRYLVEWTAWNSVRTVASLAAMAALIGGIAAA